VGEPRVSRSKAKAALTQLSRGRRGVLETTPGELLPYGVISLEPRNPAYDRDIVISAVNAVEQVLEETILTKFTLRSDSDEMLFLDNRSPMLRDFYDKCRLAYLLGIIGKKTLHDMSVIRHIRNTFAHTMGHLDLEMQQFQDMLEHITAPDRGEIIMAGTRNNDLRERFIKTCFSMIMYLCTVIIGNEQEGAVAKARHAIFSQ
jgi:hypothetical protein